MKKIYSILAISLLFISCENDVKTNSPAFQGERDNLYWKADDSKAVINPGNTVTLNAYTDHELVSLTVPNAVGTYTLGTANQSTIATYSYNNNEGTLAYYKTAFIAGPVYKLAGSNGVIVSGSGYAALNNTNLNTTGGTGHGLTVRVKTNAAGAVTEATIASRGIGYKAGDVVTIVGGNNTAKVGVLNVLKSNGTVKIEKIEGNTYTGEFSFNAVDENENVINFNKGKFYKVPVY